MLLNETWMWGILRRRRLPKLLLLTSPWLDFAKVLRCNVCVIWRDRWRVQYWTAAVLIHRLLFKNFLSFKMCRSFPHWWHVFDVKVGESVLVEVLVTAPGSGLWYCLYQLPGATWSDHLHCECYQEHLCFVLFFLSALKKTRRMNAIM